MAIKQSIGLVNFLTGEGSYRKAFEDCVFRIWSGTPPATADLAATGTLLCEVTLASVAVVSGVSDFSTPQSYELVKATGYAAGKTVKIQVVVDGVTTVYTFTALAADGSNASDAAFTQKIARLINQIDVLQAVWEGAGSNIWVECRIAGLTCAITDATGDYAITCTAKTTAARVATLQFGPPTLGVIPKPATATWSGLNLVTGVAGYGRFCIKSDDNNDTVVFNRLQLEIATSGSDMNMSNTTLTKDATLTINSGNFTEPKSV